MQPPQPIPILYIAVNQIYLCGGIKVFISSCNWH